MSNLLTVRDLSERLKCHQQTIYRLIANGDLSAIRRRGLGIRFREEDIESWIAKGKQIPQSQLAPFSNFSRASLTDLRTHDRRTSGGFSEMAKAKSKSRINLGYGALYQRKTKDGAIRWYADFREADGRRIQKVIPHARTSEEAILFLQQAVAKVFNREQGIQDQEQRITFKAFAGVYLTNYARVKKRSWRSDKKYIDSQLVPFLGILDIHEITPLHISQFMVKRQRDGVRNSTINRELTVLKKMLSLAIEWGYKIERNPVKKGNFFSEEAYRRDRVLSEDEELRLFQTAAPHLRPVLLCALATGMRYSEILRLTWENVDTKNSQVTIKAEMSKSGKQRVIPINKPLRDELLRLRRLNNGKSEFVFLYKDSTTGELRPVTTVRRAFTMACRRAKIKNLHFHDLRHTVGTRLINRGVDPISVKNILGHANLKTTEIYLHANMPQMAAAVEKLGPSGDRQSENGPDLLRICDADASPEPRPFVTPSSSIN